MQWCPSIDIGGIDPTIAFLIHVLDNVKLSKPILNKTKSTQTDQTQYQTIHGTHAQVWRYTICTGYIEVYKDSCQYAKVRT